MTTVAVVGGGVAGLTAAHRLRASLGDAAEIVLIDSADRLGGKLRTIELAGCAFDIGAEAFLVRRPEVLRLAAELGIQDEVVHPEPVPATVRAGGRTNVLPRGTIMGVPASTESVQDVLSSAGLAKVRSEAVLPPVRLAGEDVSVGGLLRERVGDEVVDRLVEPLLGGVYAGSADALGLRATVPALAAALDAGARSVTDAAASALPDPRSSARGPVFGAFRHGYQTLTDRLTERTSPQPRLGLPVRSLRRAANGWRLEIGAAGSPTELDADAVVLAVPAPAARKLLSGVVPGAAEKFAAIDVASMAVVGIAFPAGTELPAASGVLVARNETHSDGTPMTAKALTFSSRKWAHQRGISGEVLVRASVGRFEPGSAAAAELRLDDDELLRRVRADVAELTGITAQPVEATVMRWGGGLPQYGVGHGAGVAEIERAVDRIPGLAVAGAALHGVGVPACVETGEAAASAITRYLLAERACLSGTIKPWPA